MTKMHIQKTSVHQLARVRERLGPLVFLDFSTLPLEVAHYRLGREVGSQLHRWLSNKLSEWDANEFNNAVRQARCSASVLSEKTQDKDTPMEIREALADYRSCIAAWTRGAALDEFIDEALMNHQVDDERVLPLDLAFMLQNDTTGCQTGVVRAKSGNVLLWHTEEDVEEEIGSRFDRLRIVAFGVPNDISEVRVYAFVYPDLLPGVAFGWRTDGFVQAVDSLFLRPQSCGMLANIAAWISLRLGSHVSQESIIAALAPFHDGCALTTSSASFDGVTAQKTEFGGEYRLSTALDKQSGSKLFQVNVFSQRDASIALGGEAIGPSGRWPFDKRIERTQRSLSKQTFENDALPDLFRLLCSRGGGAYAYANGDVKAHVACCVSRERLELWLGPGPAMRHEQPLILIVER